MSPTHPEAVEPFDSGSIPESTNALHSEFKTLTILLALITAINNSGHPTLLAKTCNGSYRGPLETPQPNRGITLNAVTSILVRDTEVVAAIARDPNPPPHVHPSPSPALPSTASSEAPMTYKVFAMRVDQDCDQVDPEPLGTAEKIIAVTNTNHRDKPFNDHDRFVARAPLGVSHWPSIISDSWSGLRIP